MIKKNIIVFFLSVLYSENYIIFSPIISFPFENQIYNTFILSYEKNIIHTWNHDFSIASTPYYDENFLYRPCEIDSIIIDLPGAGGKIEKYNIQGELIWEYTLSSNFIQQHHDIEIMPNGNILILAYELKFQEEVINSGMLNHVGVLFSDVIIEINPTENNIVWEWHFWDHLIQDIDSNFINFGDIIDHPELLNINYFSISEEGPNPPGIENSDFVHCNSIHFSDELNQIILTSRKANEIFIIDHSTTTEEASGHLGGDYGKGGDFLYRWGNPQNYNRGNNNDQILYAPHSANWIQLGYIGEGNILIFNNGVGRPGGNYSSVIEIELPIDEEGNYFIDSLLQYQPELPYWEYVKEFDLYSNIQSGAFRLENGNTLITVTQQDLILEVNNEGEIIWQYNYMGNGHIARAMYYELNFLYGDINFDNTVDINDIIILINFILEINQFNINFQNIDFIDDNVINIYDLLYLLNLIID